VSLRNLWQRAFGLVLGLSAGIAQACPVCFSAKDEAQRQAFFDTTIFLTLLPVAMISGIAYWVARRSRELAVEEQPEAAGGLPEPTRSTALPKAATR
jgi:hypothetical protein